MITDKQDRHLFIGGSESHIIYMNYESKTFREFWRQKLEGFTEESPPNLSMAVGTILEHSVISLYEQTNGVTGLRDQTYVKGFARANTDLILPNKVSDVKVSKKALEWHTKGKVPIQYKRQLIHYRYVTGLENASIIAYQCDDQLKENPFVELTVENLFEINVEISTDEIKEHEQRVKYLEWCKSLGIFPK